MNEQLFQYLWKNSLFLPSDLKTTTGDPLVVLSPGKLNLNAGPDFLDGRIKIGNTVWAGNIELHLRASDWKRHTHDKDEAYQNIILHVVLENDEEKDTGNFPTLVLKEHIQKEVVGRYQKLIEKEEKIACYKHISNFPEIKLHSWLNRLLAERWEERLKEWETLWKQSGNDWRQLLYFRLAANFGFHVNRDPFLQLAISLPLHILAKHRNQLIQTEALLLGQSGLLAAAGTEDTYSIQLQKEYNFLRRKYELTPIHAFQWKFMRMRPSNFPTIRIAQFAMLIHQSMDLFSKMMEVKSEKEILPLLDIQASDYWDKHYRLGAESTEAIPKKLGKDAIRNIIINTIAPMQFLYAQLQGAENLIENSVTLLASLPAEQNNIIREWKSISMIPKNAAESQAFIQLFSEYCISKDCLNCAIGNYLVRDSGLNYLLV
jgi:hypothetical protein